MRRDNPADSNYENRFSNAGLEINFQSPIKHLQFVTSLRQDYSILTGWLLENRKFFCSQTGVPLIL